MLILNSLSKYLRIILVCLLVFIFLFLVSTNNVALAVDSFKIKAQESPIHPNFPFLDLNGENVLDSGEPVSTMQTCGSCHDTTFIESHSYHADVGLSDIEAPGSSLSNRPWDTSPGLYGKWNPIQYRYLSAEGDKRMDLGTPEWLMTIGIRHVGGGPAVYSPAGNLLTDLVVTPGNPATSILDHNTGETLEWDWDESGVVEMNCFLCHTPMPDNPSRIDTLHSGNFKWANSATLIASGILEVSPTGFVWNPGAFDPQGDVEQETISIQDPSNDNCGLCHGLVHDDVDDPLITVGCTPERWRTITTGQIISPQRLSDSGMNLANKEDLNRTWDIHAERLLKCTDCHYSINNPLYYQEVEATQPDHLIFDPRRVEIGEYLEKPLHQFARGDSAQSTVAPNLTNTMRRCDSCHFTDETHDWLPYTERHMQAISCETCHIPKMYSSANQTYDWTVIHVDGTARVNCRGVEGDPSSIRGLLTGYEPVWLPDADVDGDTSLAPYNLVTAFYWIYGDPPRPVRLDDLKAAYLEGDDYHPGIILRFDTNNDSEIDETELQMDSPEKIQFLAQRLILLGLDNPRIAGEIQPYSINHNVANGEWAIQDCGACHSKESRINKGIKLASFTPGGLTPIFVGDSKLTLTGEIIRNEDGSIYYQPMTAGSDLYVLGLNRVNWIDIIGTVIFLGTLGGISIHGGLRFSKSLHSKKLEHKLDRVYMYGVYERLWHWLQTFAIVILITTGLIIHRPDTFGIFQFHGVVIVHNVVAAILGINAFLSLFYHLVSGEIKQYIPHPQGFFDQSITQALYYLRGIFQNAEHPFEKTPSKKLNPLQQVTYFAILNVLLPLQGITGILIWGAQRWPGIAESLGGLLFLAPFHTMIAWMFAAFIVLHVYLTTTGPKPLTGIKAMMMGWEDIEVHYPLPEMENQESNENIAGSSA